MRRSLRLFSRHQLLLHHLSRSCLSLKVHHSVLSLLIPHPHVILEVRLWPDQVEFPDQLNKVITADPLSTLLEALIFVDLVDHLFVLAVFAPTILDEDVELNELKAVIGVLSGEHQSVVRIHARCCLIIVRYELRVEVEDLLKPHVFRILVVYLSIDADMEVLVNRNMNFDLFCETAQSLEPSDSLRIGTLSLDKDDFKQII